MACVAIAAPQSDMSTFNSRPTLTPFPLRVCSRVASPHTKNCHPATHAPCPVVEPHNGIIQGLLAAPPPLRPVTLLSTTHLVLLSSHTMALYRGCLLPLPLPDLSPCYQPPTWSCCPATQWHYTGAALCCGSRPTWSLAGWLCPGPTPACTHTHIHTR
jgi:hypothetical protein